MEDRVPPSPLPAAMPKTALVKALPWVTALVVLTLDRWSKAVVMDAMPVGSWRELMPGLAVTHVHNSGIAFSLFADGGPISRLLLHAVILTAVVLIAWMLVRHGQQTRIAAMAFGLILGGAVGNLVDRVLYGWVVDFVHLWVRLGDRTLSWPDFNVADSAITVGACLLVLSELRSSRSRDGAGDGDAPDAD
jgi:signal peptidase II